MEVRKDDILQSLCRAYLKRLLGMAEKRGMVNVVGSFIKENVRGECKATRDEVEALSCLCDDERIKRSDIPMLVGKSYRECCEGGVFGAIGTLRHVGIYSKVDALLYSEGQKD